MVSVSHYLLLLPVKFGGVATGRGGGGVGWVGMKPITFFSETVYN